MADVDVSSLRAGDVLLYHGNSFLARIIRLLDGGNYSHASIFDGVHVMEALGNGINVRSVQESIAGTPYVDVFRFRGSDGQQLGSPGLPLTPLTASIKQFEATPERYAYEEILLLAALCTTRKVPLPPGIGIVVRSLLDSAAELVTNLTAAGKQPVICSQLVFLCYQNAGEQYKFLIRGADQIPTAATVAAQNVTDASEQALVAQSAQNFLMRYALAQHPGSTPAAMTAMDMMTALAVANFVTPHDLEASPSLLRLGTLRTAVAPVVTSFPSVATASKTAAMAAAAAAAGAATLPVTGHYHKDLLIVKNATIPISESPGVIRSFVADRSSGPGMMALAHFEKTNRIKRVTPLARHHRAPLRAQTAVGTFVACTLMTAPVPDGPDPNLGVSLLEIQSESDLITLRDELAKDPSVEFASLVPVRYAIAATGSAPSPLLWDLNRIQWPQAQTKVHSAATIKVAVLDTGVDRTHPFLFGLPIDYTFDNPAVAGAASDRDLVGHGTHVSGTILAKFNSANSMRGICDCELSVWKIFGDQPVYYSDGFNAQFLYVVDHGMYLRALADCVDGGFAAMNLSIGGPGAPDPQEQALFQQLLANGVAVVAAMGNAAQAGNPTEYPGAIPGVIAVGATDQNDQVASFSSYGPHIALSAPGVSILSTLPTYPGQSGFYAVSGPGGWVPGSPITRATMYDSWNGTSMATPHVTASVASLIATHGSMSPASVKQRLQQSADKVAGMNGGTFDNWYGAGRLNLFQLL